MALFKPTFKDVVMKTEYLKCHIGLARFGGRFKEAQEWLDKTIMQKMHPVIPYRTGEFLGKIINENASRYGTGQLRVSVPPQGRRLYGGINPNTGKPFNWTNPLTQPRWGSWVVQTYKPELMRGVKEILKKKGK